MGSLWHAFVLWFQSVIEFFYAITGSIGLPNYGLGIILLTIVIKLVLFPLNQRQLKSMRAMQEIQPKMKYIQEKYKDDAQVMQTKLMQLYKDHGVSPLSGCLPLLIQMPIFFAFYQALISFKFTVAAHASFLWIPNIGSKDPYFLLAILAGLTTYLQQRVSMVDTKDPTQKTMLYFMPVFMAYIATTVPAGLPLYWAVFNILGILQQLYVNYTHEQSKLATPAGVIMDAAIEEEKEEIKPEVKKDPEAKKAKASEPDKSAKKDKGGKTNNGAPNNRKKRKNR
ncbi:MAG: YidC/Oxa1 family membrane protein insertase [Deltaproteobacteria bacterium]